MPRKYVENLARKQLAGVGDRGRGEWVEFTDKACHVRRRLSAEEELVIGPVKDIRGTKEAEERLAKHAAYLPAGWEE